MVKRLIWTLGILFFLSGAAMAQSWEMSLDAGTTSLSGGVHYKMDMTKGFLKFGGTGVYTDDDDMEYKWATVDFLVGNDALQQGLTVEAGVKGIIGDAKDNGRSGDVGALAFAGQFNYLFPRRVIPIPLEVFGNVTYAPEMLCFSDSDDFMSLNIGVGYRIIPNASIIVDFTAYDLDMESGPGNWNLDDEVFRMGIVMRF